MDTTTTVIFRTFPDGDVIALMPYELADDDGHITSYQHIGQHGAADYHYCIEVSRAAADSERAPLLRELQQIGYIVKEAKRASGAYRRRR